MGLCLSRVQFVQVVQIVQNVLNGLNGLSVLNSVSASGSPQFKTQPVREIAARWAAALIRYPRAGACETP
jgi:hypothetical protein